MLQYSSVQKRVYCQYFSVNIHCLIPAIIILAIANTPVDKLNLSFIDSSNYSFSLNYIGSLILCLGFRGVTDGAVTMHKIFACILGMIPIFFLAVLSIMSGIAMLFNLYLAAASMSLELLWDENIIEIIIRWFPMYLWACAVWLLFLKFIFKHYSRFEYAGDHNKYTAVCLLLLFTGFLGGHRFYAGRPITGALYMFSLGFLGLGVLFDIYLLYTRKFKDFQGTPV